MLKGIFNIAKRVVSKIRSPIDEKQYLLLGKLLSNQQQQIRSENINDFEFKVFSQFGDDGIIQYLIKLIKIKNHTFIEFGVEDYRESNTRFLLMNNNWSGYIIDCSEDAMLKVKKQSWYWMYDLRTKVSFIDKDNINSLLMESEFQDVGILSMDVDGNDYHLLDALDLTILNPSIIIAEYNSVFGIERAISVPYKKDFYRTTAHYSNLYFGASLSALNHCCVNKGYSLVACNNAGNNAYFVRNDLLNDNIKTVTTKDAFKESKYRESRDSSGQLSYVSGKKRFDLLTGLVVYNVITESIEKI